MVRLSPLQPADRLHWGGRAFILGSQSMSNFLLQKRPDGESKWADEEGRSCHFAQRLPNAKILRKNDRVLFDRPLKCGTSEDGCIYDQAIVARLIAGDDGHVDAHLTDFVGFLRPVRLIDGLLST